MVQIITQPYPETQFYDKLDALLSQQDPAQPERIRLRIFNTKVYLMLPLATLYTFDVAKKYNLLEGINREISSDIMEVNGTNFYHRDGALSANDARAQPLIQLLQHQPFHYQVETGMFGQVEA